MIQERDKSSMWKGNDDIKAMEWGKQNNSSVNYSVCHQTNQKY